MLHPSLCTYHPLCITSLDSFLQSQPTPQFTIILTVKMSRRPVSPLRSPIRADPSDTRDNMIRKLKDDLILARGREKELAILENYLVELIEKTKLLTAEIAKSDEEGKLKLQLTLKTINELKKEVDLRRGELRNITNELSEVEEEEAELRKLLNAKMIEIQKLKKEGLSLHSDNQKLLNQHYRLRAQEDETIFQIKKLTATMRDYEGRLSQIGRKIIEVKSFINEMAEENTILKQKLKGYQKQNTGIGNDLQSKQNKIDNLERTFAQKHEQIKNLVENYIQLQHANQKNIKETKHALSMAKIETEKYNELAGVIKKIEKSIGDKSKDLDQVRQESEEIRRINHDFTNQNARLKQDLANCQEHLQNVLKHNAFIQEEMEKFVREDEAIIGIIRRKKLIPSFADYNSLRTSRNEGKNTNRTYL